MKNELLDLIDQIIELFEDLKEYIAINQANQEVIDQMYMKSNIRDIMVKYIDKLDNAENGLIAQNELLNRTIKAILTDLELFSKDIKERQGN